MSFGADVGSAETDLGWDHDGLADLAARLIDAGGSVAEIDALTSSQIGTGRGGLPTRHFVFPAYEYVRAILAGGLEIEGEAAERIAGAVLAGGADFDYASTLDVFDQGFNAGAGRRLRVRTLDRLLEQGPQPKLLLFGGHGVRPDILRGGRETLLASAPVVAVRPDSSQDLQAFAAALREIEPTYEWVAPTHAGIHRSSVRPYCVALAAGRARAPAVAQAFSRAFAPRAPRSTLAAHARAFASLHVAPDMFVASRGFYAAERNDGYVWRWGGVSPRLSVLLEAPAPGVYEIRVTLDNVVFVAGAIEGISDIRVNGALLVNVPRPSDAGFVATARIVRSMLLEIDCSVRRIVPPDRRLLSLSVTGVTLSQIAD